MTTLVDSKPLLTLTEAGTALGLNYYTLYRWVRRGLIPSVVLPSGQRRVSRKTVEIILKGDPPRRD